jgi:hypothetical protein
MDMQKWLSKDGNKQKERIKNELHQTRLNKKRD